MVHFNLAAIVAEDDFLINLICPESSRVGSLAKETVDCGPDAVIDVIWARVALFGNTNLCYNSNFDVLADIIKDIPVAFPCLAELPFVVYDTSFIIKDENWLQTYTQRKYIKCTNKNCPTLKICFVDLISSFSDVTVTKIVQLTVQWPTSLFQTVSSQEVLGFRVILSMCVTNVSDVCKIQIFLRPYFGEHIS